MQSFWRNLYAICAAAVIISLILGLDPVYMTAKALLMVILLLYFFSMSAGFPRWRWHVVLALIFSWVGDVCLIFSDWFVQGLIAFLIAHLFYIIAYHQTGAATGLLKAADIVKVSVYGVILIAVIYPGLGQMLVPVLLYAGVLLAMVLWAHKRRNATNRQSFTLVATGAVLFAISDGMIAINKFAMAIPAERILIMSVYITAQFLIIQGLIKYMERT